MKTAVANTGQRTRERWTKRPTVRSIPAKQSVIRRTETNASREISDQELAELACRIVNDGDRESSRRGFGWVRKKPIAKRFDVQAGTGWPTYR